MKGVKYIERGVLKLLEVRVPHHYLSSSFIMSLRRQRHRRAEMSAKLDRSTARWQRPAKRSSAWKLVMGRRPLGWSVAQVGEAVLFSGCRWSVAE